MTKQELLARQSARRWATQKVFHEDPLAAARGIKNALLISLGFWTIVAAIYIAVRG